MRNTCPYCDTGSFLQIAATRPRPETQKVLQCSTCQGFSVRVRSGEIKPLADRNDPDSDVGNKVID